MQQLNTSVLTIANNKLDYFDKGKTSDFNNAHLLNQCKNPILKIKLVCYDDNTNTDLGGK